MTVTTLVLELFVLYKSFLQLMDEETAHTTDGVQELSQSHLCIPYPAVIDVCGLSKEVNDALKYLPYKNDHQKIVAVVSD